MHTVQLLEDSQTMYNKWYIVMVNSYSFVQLLEDSQVVAHCTAITAVPMVHSHVQLDTIQDPSGLAHCTAIKAVLMVHSHGKSLLTVQLLEDSQVV